MEALRIHVEEEIAVAERAGESPDVVVSLDGESTLRLPEDGVGEAQAGDARADDDEVLVLSHGKLASIFSSRDDRQKLIYFVRPGKELG